MFASEAIYRLIKLEFSSVLDVGSGEGEHSDFFLSKNKEVTAIDIGTSEYFKLRKQSINFNFIRADFNDFDLKGRKWDTIWCSHVLEHQRNVGRFLEKIINATNENGYIALTVPPRKDNIVGGHLTIWNAGLLIYNLVMAGLDCSEAMVKTYGYNISIIVKKKLIQIPNNLDMDIGDIEKLSSFFPKGYDRQNFNGFIEELNWN